MMELSASQVVAIAEIVRPGETVHVTVIDGVAMVEVINPDGELALLELMARRQDPPHLHLTDFGVRRPPPAGHPDENTWMREAPPLEFGPRESDG